MNEKQTKPQTTMKQTIISVIGPSCCGKSQYIKPITEQLILNGYTVDVPHFMESDMPKLMKKFKSNAQFVFLHIASNSRNNPNMRIEFHDWDGPMDLIEALYEKRTHALPPPPVVKDSLTPALPMDDDLDAIQAEEAEESAARAEATKALARLALDDDLDEPLGQACSRDNPECESCT